MGRKEINTAATVVGKWSKRGGRVESFRVSSTSFSTLVFDLIMQTYSVDL